VAYADQLDDPLNTAHAYRLAAEYACVGGDLADAVAWADRSLAIAEEHGYALRAAMAAATRIWALGDAAAQRAALDEIAASGQHVGEPLARCAIATTLLAQGHVAVARAELTRAFAFVEASGEERHLAELHRAAAACARAEGEIDLAEAELRRALAVSRAQEARLFELRAVADLAELLAERGRTGEARTLLESAQAGPGASGPRAELERIQTLRAQLT
jgi:ATP/maltotriose-dependent transcriptional regulator MalT